VVIRVVQENGAWLEFINDTGKILCRVACDPGIGYQDEIDLNGSRRTKDSFTLTKAMLTTKIARLAVIKTKAFAHRNNTSNPRCSWGEMNEAIDLMIDVLLDEQVG